MSIKAILDCLQTQKENSELDTAKLCLIDDGINGACPNDVPPEGLNKAANTLTLMGDVAANYPGGQLIDLQNANGESCGSATAAAEPAPAYNAENDSTVVTITGCELDEGKTAAQVTQAKPVPPLVATAIDTVKVFAAKRALKTTKG